jgi:hypothetical protein
MKIAILFISCAKYSIDGTHQSLRDTFLKDVPKFPGLDYRFLIGDGTPTGEDESEMRAALKDSRHSVFDDYKIDTNHPKNDEIIAHVPDDYAYSGWKDRESLRWSYKNGYDYTFMAACDTYIDIPRLMHSGFEKHDYSGRLHRGSAPETFAIGGAGYWLRSEVLPLFINKPVTHWAGDYWLGRILEQSGVIVHGDRRYGQTPQQHHCVASEGRDPLFPLQDNEQITAHLNEAPGTYNNMLMYFAHAMRTGDRLAIERLSEAKRVHDNVWMGKLDGTYIAASPTPTSIVTVEKIQRNLRWTPRKF